METLAVREYVAGLYPTANWKERVANMPNAQVYAIYRKELVRRQKKKLTLTPRKENEENHQITIWEYLASKEA